MNKTTRAQVTGYIETLRKHYKADISMWSSAPGDGIRRYHFTTKIKQGTVERICLGSREAFEYLSGIRTGADLLRS